MNIGILGGGQLARMLALAGHSMGVQSVCLDPAADACAFDVAHKLCGPYDDAALLGCLADEADVVTFEFENVPAASGELLAQRLPVFPPANALAMKQDRLTEKRLFEELGIPTTPFRAVQTSAELNEAAERLGLPIVLKTRSYGYDGKGQFLMHEDDHREEVLAGFKGAPLIAERFIHFDREVSLIAVRAQSGATAFYDIAENVHREGILRVSRNRPGDPRTVEARAYADKLMSHFDYVGTLGFEFFEKDGKLLANEFAPRVHNSGHWTIEGAETSQFENHLRAVFGWPLGETSSTGSVAMVNCIGTVPDADAILEIPGAHFHVYGKAERPRRKVGHVTIRAQGTAELESRIAMVTSRMRDKALARAGHSS